MSLETISAIAQLIAALGVIASLFYLAAQIRQNTRSQWSVVVDLLTQSLIALIGPQPSDLDQMRALVAITEDWHGASEADRLRAVSMLFTSSKFSKMHGFSNARELLMLSNGKLGIFTSGCTIIGRA